MHLPQPNRDPLSPETHSAQTITVDRRDVRPLPWGKAHSCFLFSRRQLLVPVFRGQARNCDGDWEKPARARASDPLHQDTTTGNMWKLSHPSICAVALRAGQGAWPAPLPSTLPGRATCAQCRSEQPGLLLASTLALCQITPTSAYLHCP